jgi:hypothetical protein
MLLTLPTTSRAIAHIRARECRTLCTRQRRSGERRIADLGIVRTCETVNEQVGHKVDAARERVADGAGHACASTA